MSLCSLVFLVSFCTNVQTIELGGRPGPSAEPGAYLTITWRF